MEKNAEKAFQWIVGLLRSHGIAFQVTGGLAARSYGSPRPLYDIDIKVPEASIAQIAPLVAAHIIYGPTRCMDDAFDIELMTLLYEGQKIDIGGYETARIYDAMLGEWVSCGITLDTYEMRTVYDVEVPVMRKADLIAFKEHLRRPTDIEDIAMLQDRTL